MGDKETTYWDVRDRYMRDAEFHAVVDMMMAFMTTHKYTASEMRDAAFMAAVQFESIHCRQVIGKDLPWLKDHG